MMFLPGVLRGQRLGWLVLSTTIVTVSCGPGREGGVVMSGLDIGDTLPLLTTRIVRAADSSLPLGALPCRILVYFEPECPHCEVAAMRDAAPSGDAVMASWLTNSDSDDLRQFLTRVGGGFEVLTAAQASKLLAVRAVPVAFLVSQDNVLRLVFPYSGGVSAAKLRPYCDNPPL